MSSKKKPSENIHKNKITVETKHEFIEKREKGMSVVDLARTYNWSTSTICTILKNKHKLIDASKGVSIMSMKRLPIFDDVEKLLLIWINKRQLQGNIINGNIYVRRQNLFLPTSLRRRQDHQLPKKKYNSREVVDGLRRTGIHTVLRHSEVASSNTKKTVNFIRYFKKILDSGGYLPQQVFNCDETGLFWKKMLKQTYITIEENAMPGHKLSKDRLSLLFCANASGELKIKPLLVYHSETPQAFISSFGS